MGGYGTQRTRTFIMCVLPIVDLSHIFNLFQFLLHKCVENMLQ